MKTPNIAVSRNLPCSSHVISQPNLSQSRLCRKASEVLVSVRLLSNLQWYVGYTAAICVVSPCRLESFGEAMAIIEFARTQAAQKARGLAHPQLCLDAVQEGVARGGKAGLKKVRVVFSGDHALLVVFVMFMSVVAHGGKAGLEKVRV